MTCAEKHEDEGETFHIVMLRVNLSIKKWRCIKLKIHPSFRFSVMSDAEYTVLSANPLSFASLKGL